MPYPIGSVVRRALFVPFALLFIAAAAPASAQQAVAIREAPASAEFLSRFDYTLSAAKLRYEDPRFSWDVHWAGDFDLVDYVHGRVTFLADYQMLLGSEFRPFDPFQSSYTLEAMASGRVKRTEVFGVLSHVSRHFGDRANRVAVAENSLGVRVLRRQPLGRIDLDVRADVRKVIQHSYVDYTWITDLDLTLSHDVNERASAYIRGWGQLVPVDASIAGRETQRGGRAEAGVRFKGTGASMEFFAGGERVIDADQLDRVTRQWAFVGFRLLGN